MQPKKFGVTNMAKVIDKFLNTFFLIVSEATKSELRKRLEAKHRYGVHNHRRV